MLEKNDNKGYSISDFADEQTVVVDYFTKIGIEATKEFLVDTIVDSNGNKIGDGYSDCDIIKFTLAFFNYTLRFIVDTDMDDLQKLNAILEASANIMLRNSDEMERLYNTVAKLSSSKGEDDNYDSKR
jgi:hypothetical protein